MRDDQPLFDAARFFTTDAEVGALRDENGDGYPDGLRAWIVLAGTPSAAEWVELLHLAARLGLETGGLDFPLAQMADAPLSAQALALVFHPGAVAPAPEPDAAAPAGRRVPLHGAGAVRALWQAGFHTGEIPQVPEPARSPLTDLADCYELGGCYADDDGDRFPDRARVCIVVPDELPLAVGLALLDLAGRLGLETAGLRFPLAVTAAEPLPTGTFPLLIELTSEAPAWLAPNTTPAAPPLQAGEGACVIAAQDDGTPALAVYGDATGLVAALRGLAGSWPCLGAWGAAQPTARDLTGEVTALLHGEGRLGRAARLASELVAPTTVGATTVRLLTDDPDLAAVARGVAATLPGHPAVTEVADDRIAFVDEWTAEWEVDHARRLVDRALARVEGDQPVELLVMVSEPEPARRALAEELRSRALPAGSTVQVLAAFKPGLCWLREVVGPALAARGGVARVAVFYRPFVPPAETRHLDLRIRWLQELFPGDEVLAGMLGLPLDRITLIEDEDQTDIYRVVAFDGAGREVATLVCSPRSYTRPYLDAFPEEGRVLCTTGAVRAWQGGRLLFDEAVPTDLDRFWEYYQRAVLPAVHRSIVAETAGAPSAAAQPFFASLDVEVWASEPDEWLGIRQETCSSAEALHEDIYFATLDVIASLGNVSGWSGTLGGAPAGDALDAPGAVRPFVHVTPGGAPRARITLRRRLRHLAELVRARPDGAEERTVLGRLPTGPRPRVAVSWATWRAGQLGVGRLGLAVNGGPPDAAVLLHYAAASEVGTRASVGLVIQLPDGGVVNVTWPVPVVADYGAPAATDGAAVPLDVVIGEEELRPLLARLATLPGVGARRLERSFEGRAIDAVEVLAPPGPGVWSRVKAALYKPTLLIVARHHANEVASTPAALRLVELLAADPAYQALLARTNVVVLPLENADGAALHYAMQREHPTWKLHAARYNAVGLEFAREFFNPDTPYGEARARPRLWERWRPDVMTDNHGIPSHEWNQLFSGFNSPPRFGISYWLVQAHLYGILRYPTDDPAHQAFAEALREAVTRAVAADPELLAWNRTFRERYVTWGASRLPDRFPADYFGEMLWFFQPLPEGWRERTRQPDDYYRVTTVNWVTEVADETAQGDYLASVARAHLTANRATLQLLAALAPPVTREAGGRDGAWRLVFQRARPLPSTALASTRP